MSHIITIYIVYFFIFSIFLIYYVALLNKKINKNIKKSSIESQMDFNIIETLIHLKIR
jgi:fucose 4-O-acetylase-like acetyltransferase